MILKQKNTGLKLAELLAAFALLILMQFLFLWDVANWPISPLLIVVVLFSLRYGLGIGMISFLLGVVYEATVFLIRGNDPMLLFIDERYYGPLLLMLFLAVACGVFSTSFRERYDTLATRQDELAEENLDYRKTVDVLERSQQSMEEKVLESEYTLARLYELANMLELPSPELIRNEAITLIGNLFDTENLGIYHLDSSKRALRLHVGKGENGSLHQSIYIEESSIYDRAIRTGEVAVRQLEDADGTPILAGPIRYADDVQEMLIIPQLPLKRLQKYELQILSIILTWLSNRIGREEVIQVKEDRSRVHPGTHIYYKEDFDEMVALQKERAEQFDVPYSMVSLDLRQNNIDLKEADRNLGNMLRELDIVGYDDVKGYLYLLLPGTEPDDSSIVAERIEEKLGLGGAAIES